MSASQEAEITQNDFEGDKPYCDLIMKGGITSGVIYPKAIVTLARKYRFKSIGGTSAGAIAAAFTAAAEYNRDQEGFIKINAIADEIATTLLSLFQPAKDVRPLFQILLAILGGIGPVGKSIKAVRAVLSGYWPWTLIGAGLGLAPTIVPINTGWNMGWVVAETLLIPISITIVLMCRLVWAIKVDLRKNKFGLCPGKTQPGYDSPGLSDWLADRLDDIAGLQRPDKPLTFGDLRKGKDGTAGIELKFMTTNLSLGRPYSLPMQNRLYSFRKSEFEDLFPERIVNWLVSKGEKCGDADFYFLPEPDDLPIVVAVRMSISFPLLFQAVPLYTRDFTLIDKQDQQVPRRCWFSDGGISSNFPIHFFDQLWPSRPTFGISLTEYDEKRYGAVTQDPGPRVKMPSTARQGILLPVNDIQNIGSFLFKIMSVAKDWPDNLQGTLPGYRERIVQVALTPDEGGLNLDMNPDKVNSLTNLGAIAGDRMLDFDFNEHRWRRFLIALARLEETIEAMRASHTTTPVGGDSFGTFLQNYPQTAKSYGPKNQDWLEDALAWADQLLAVDKSTNGQSLAQQTSKIPKPACNLRITPVE
jgi:predicted acylesterase/phospholipase RssA